MISINITFTPDLCYLLTLSAKNKYKEADFLKNLFSHKRGLVPVLGEVATPSVEVGLYLKWFPYI